MILYHRNMEPIVKATFSKRVEQMMHLGHTERDSHLLKHRNPGLFAQVARVTGKLVQGQLLCPKRPPHLVQKLIAFGSAIFSELFFQSFLLCLCKEFSELLMAELAVALTKLVKDVGLHRCQTELDAETAKLRLVSDLSRLLFILVEKLLELLFGAGKIYRLIFKAVEDFGRALAFYLVSILANHSFQLCQTFGFKQLRQTLKIEATQGNRQCAHAVLKSL